MQYHNFHTHSIYSDGKYTLREMTDAAIERGFTNLGFSDHSNNRVESYYCMMSDWERSYRKKVRALSEEYADRIKIHLGVEQDSESEIPDFDYDYIISSVHEMARRGVSLPIDSSPELQRKLVDELFHGSTDDFAKAYFEKVADNVARNRTDIIGHFDLVTKYSAIPETESYITSALEGVRECMKYCDLFELNTGAIARGLTALPYPAGFILDEIRERGGRIIVTSDCHYREKLTVWFREAEDYLTAHGFIANENGSINDKINGIRIWEAAKEN